MILPGVFNALEQNPADVVLLHAGKNDIDFDDPNLTIMDIESILNEIDL